MHCKYLRPLWVPVWEFPLGGQLGDPPDRLKARKDGIEAVTISEKYIDYLWKIKRARETVQYGTSMNYGETDAIMENAREFVGKMKLAANGLDETEMVVDYLVRKIRELELETANE